MMIPSSLYKLPAHTKHVLLTDNVLFVHQNNSSASLTITESTPIASGSASSSCITTVGQSNSTTDMATSETNSSQESENKNDPGDIENVISVVSCALSTTKIGDDCEFSDRSVLGSFKFPPDERILNIMPMTLAEKDENGDAMSNDGAHEVDVKSTYSKYLGYQSKLKTASKFDDGDRNAKK